MDWEGLRISPVIISATLLTTLLLAFLPADTNAQFPYEFQSSRKPVKDIFELGRVLKNSNENPGSYMTTVCSLLFV